MQTEDKLKEEAKAENAIRREILPYVSKRIGNILGAMEDSILKTLEEIRLRVNKPLMITNNHSDYYFDTAGKLTNVLDNLFCTFPEDVAVTLELMSENSVYAYQEEIKNGFITLKGGHRVGITGKVVMENNSVKNIKDISGLNIRVSREVIGCSEKIFKYIINGTKDVFNTLIISPPQCGKTTMLRDLSRLLGDGSRKYKFSGIKVGLIDERSEIASSFRGVPQNRIGVRTDVLDSCPKTIGMNMLIRSMSPQVIVTDEIGNEGDSEAVRKVLNSGVKIIASAHGYNISQLKSRKEVLRMIDEKLFERYVVLSNENGPGTLEEVLEGESMELLYKKNRGGFINDILLHTV